MSATETKVVKVPHAYKLQVPLEIRDAEGRVVRSIGVVNIVRRPVFRDIKAVQRTSDEARTGEILARLTDLEAPLIDDLDLEDVLALVELVSPFFESSPGKKAG